MIGLQWWVGDSKEHSAIAEVAVAALGGGASVVRGPFEAAPEAHVWFVFASDLERYLASLSAAERARRCERTILVNAERTDVLELLEAHGLAGAIECEEPDAWAAYDARMFIHKDVVAANRGERIGGPGRESEHYVLWTHRDQNTNTCRLANLVRAYAGACVSYATRFDELVLRAEDARPHQLPAVGMRMIVGRTGLLARTFPRAGTYLELVSPPGGACSFVVEACDDAPVTDLARHLFTGEVVFAAPEHIAFAGGQRTAVACESRDPMGRRIASCLVTVSHRTGTVLALLTSGLAAGAALSCAAVLGHPSLAIIAGSFTLEEGR